MALFTSGRDALKEVANPDGAWNWALVGPMPEELHLAGGGSGSIEEMQFCISEGGHSVLYGLLRLSFMPNMDEVTKADKRLVTKFVFVQARGGVGAAGAGPQDKQRNVGQGMGQRPAMERVFRAWAHWHLAFEAHEDGDMSVESVLNQLANASNWGDKELITLTTYQAWLRPNMEAHRPQEHAKVRAIMEGQAREDGQDPPGDQAFDQALGQCIFAPVFKDKGGQSVAEPEAEAGTDGVQRQRRKFEMPKKGDGVKVFSPAEKVWLNDGMIVNVAHESGIYDGSQVQAGSVMVRYKRGRLHKWFNTVKAAGALQPSDRPRPPAAVCGELRRAKFDMATEWVPRYFELQVGYLQVWESQKGAQEGAEPKVQLCLYGLKTELAGDKVHLQSITSKGFAYTFDRQSTEETECFYNALKAHGKYCEDIIDYLQKRVDEASAANKLAASKSAATSAAQKKKAEA